NMELPFYRLMGNRDCFDKNGLVYKISKFNLDTADYANSHENFYINDINYLQSLCGIDNWCEPKFWYMYKLSVSPDCIPLLCKNLSFIIKSIFGKNKKALALDLDNTLWGGVVGDDGADNLEIGMETGLGEAYLDFQNYVKKLSELGVVLTIVSKNDEQNAFEGLGKRECVLKPSDFASIKANWQPKDENIAEIAAEINLLPESFVFADDNPAEREIASGNIPGLAVPEMTSPENYIAALDRAGYFEVTSLSDDDLKRSAMYLENAKRINEVKKYENYGDYLKSLEMKAEITDFKPEQLQRITALTNKSNQFNCTTKRYGINEITEIAENPNYIKLCGRLTDKFGDNGIVSVVIGEIKDKELHIDLWIMSCRVLKRDMEFAMCNELIRVCKIKGIETVYGYYFKTSKNSMVEDLYLKFGFEKLTDTKFKLQISEYKEKEVYL
ncbi:MAG: HAD-IIIC family phosphatase, partial [Ruminococcus sp.]|nr:HAD-IIIC family phosphatase [Ruminococcus sp.]